MFSLQRPAPLLALLCLAYLLTVGFLSRHYPSPNSDEAIITVHGYNNLKGWGHRYSLYDDVFASEAYILRDAFPDITRTFYNTYLGFFAWLSDRSFWGIRLSSAFAGVIALVGLFGIGKRLGGPALGFLTALVVAINPIFLTASCIARYEVPLFACLSGLLWWILSPSTLRWRNLALGLIGGLLVGIHPNSVTAFIGIIVVDLVSNRPKKRFLYAIHVGAGFAAGVILLIATVDMTRLAYSLRYTLYYKLVSPPLLTWPWQPFLWIQETAKTFWTSPTFNLQSQLMRGWQEANLLYWFAAAISLVLIKLKPEPWKRAFSFALLAAFSSLFLLVKRQEITYYLVLFPFLAPLVSSAVSKSSGRVWKGLVGTVLVLSLGSFLIFVRGYSKIAPSYAAITSQVKVLLQDDEKVMGPNFLWFALKEGQFRDIGALLYSRWYTGGGRDIYQWIKPWQPDVLVVDDPTRNVFFKTGELENYLKSTLPVEVQLRGVVDTGPAAYGNLQILSLNWKQSEKGESAAEDRKINKSNSP